MVPINGTTLVDHRVFVLGGRPGGILMGPATFEVGLNAISTTDPHISTCFQFPFRPEEVYSSGLKLVNTSTDVLFQRIPTNFKIKSTK